MSAQAQALPEALEPALESHRRELTGYCYRMLGSTFEAEDAVQETLVRAWRGSRRLQARAALRSWLYRIATNVCLDMLSGSERRARPMDLGGPSPVEAILGSELPEHRWIQPVPNARVLPDTADPAELTAARETIRLAFVAALQLLPPRQRAVLILRDVLRWQAAEVAELLESSVASVNSALQRARATIEASDAGAAPPPLAEGHERDLLDRYVDAFERYDIDELVSLLREDATFSMPPHALYLRGRAAVHEWMSGPGAACDGSLIRRTWGSGTAAFAVYRHDPAGGHAPFTLSVVEVVDGAIAGIHNYLYPDLFLAFGLPMHLDA